MANAARDAKFIVIKMIFNYYNNFVLNLTHFWRQITDISHCSGTEQYVTADTTIARLGMTLLLEISLF